MTPLEPSQYVHTVTFTDPAQPSEGLGGLVHVTSRILLDGENVPGIIDAELSFARSEPTIVTLTVLAEHAALPFVADDGTHVPGGIAGHPVLATAQDEHPWEYVNLAAQPNLSSDYPIAEVAAVRCSFFVPQVAFE